MTAEMAEPLRAAVQRYFDGHATGSPSVMRRAFHESARLQFIRDGGVSPGRSMSISPGCRAGQADDESQRTRRIVSMWSDGNIASAEVELDYPAVRFVDHLARCS